MQPALDITYAYPVAHHLLLSAVAHHALLQAVWRLFAWAAAFPRDMPH
jgi:hypothetical protein